MSTTRKSQRMVEKAAVKKALVMKQVELQNIDTARDVLRSCVLTVCLSPPAGLALRWLPACFRGVPHELSSSFDRLVFVRTRTSTLIILCAHSMVVAYQPEYTGIGSIPSWGCHKGGNIRCRPDATGRGGYQAGGSGGLCAFCSIRQHREKRNLRAAAALSWGQYENRTRRIASLLLLSAALVAGGFWAYDLL